MDFEEGTNEFVNQTGSCARSRAIYIVFLAKLAEEFSGLISVKDVSRRHWRS
jgi:hypothetical protein